MATNGNGSGNGNCTILWSTQSGRAKACARRVTRLVKEQSTLSVQSQSTFDELGWASLQSQETQLWILLVSTTGDGEHCDSIQETWKQLCVRYVSFAKQLNVVPLRVLYPMMLFTHSHHHMSHPLADSTNLSPNSNSPTYDLPYFASEIEPTVLNFARQGESWPLVWCNWAQLHGVRWVMEMMPVQMGGSLEIWTCGWKKAFYGFFQRER
jgi:hypothetical protein